MIFRPQDITRLEGSFKIPKIAVAKAPKELCDRSIAELWRGYTFRCSALELEAIDELCFRIGSASPIPLDGAAYSINVEPCGVCVHAKSTADLRLGVITMLDRIVASGLGECKLDCCRLRESPRIEKRMAHFCVFPETRLYELRRFVRSCAALRFSHLIVEFWGTLKYDCLAELSWRDAFTKDDIAPIVREAHALGLELIPMFNHWGHASAGRDMHGKHVVLDQDPSLQYYFSDDGWCWDIKRPCVRELQRRIRIELCELFGEGEYFHIGCDEARGFEMTEENMNMICEHINEIAAEMKLRGRRVIIWGDMLLSSHRKLSPDNKYECSAPTAEAERYMLSHISRDVIIADWQYDAKKAPVETALALQSAGFDTILCSWDRSPENIRACLDTVKEHSLMGYMHTTWHTLSGRFPFLTLAGKGCFEDTEGLDRLSVAAHTAALLRKVYFTDGDRAMSGWSRADVGELY